MTVRGLPPGFSTTPPRRAPSPLLVALVALGLLVVIGGAVAIGLKLGPFAPSPTQQAAIPTLPPTETSEPTNSATAGATNGTPTIQPTTGPTDFPAPSDGPPATPNGATEELMSHVPEGIRDSCLPTDFLEPILAMVSCLIGDGEITVDYARYPDLNSMYAAYNERVRIAEIETDSGLCFTSSGGTISTTPDRWPAEHHYNVDGQPVGRYLCLNNSAGSPSINWTHDRLIVLGVTSSGPEFVDRLVTFWVNDSGPSQ